MLSFKDFQELCEKPETMQQFVEVEFETKHLFGFVMKTWYQDFYTSYSIIELNQDNDVRMLQFINDARVLRKYDYLHVDWNTGQLCDQLLT